MPRTGKISNADDFPTPSPHLDRYPMLRLRTRSRTTSQTTVASTNSSGTLSSTKRFQRPSNANGLDVIMKRIKVKNKSCYARDPNSVLDIERSPLEQLFDDLTACLAALPAHSSSPEPSKDFTALLFEEDYRSAETPRMSDEPTLMSISEVPRSTPEVYTADRSTTNTPTSSDSDLRSHGHRHCTATKVTREERNEIAAEPVKRGSWGMRVYDDHKPAHLQPQTPADLRHPKRRAHSPSPTEIAVATPLTMTALVARLREHTLREAEDVVETLAPAAASCEHRSQPGQGHENTADLYTERLASDLGAWTHATSSADLNITPPAAGRYAKYL